MVESIKQYKDVISGRIFDNEYDAIQSETKSIDIKNTFESFGNTLDECSCDFANGEYCIQRSEMFLNLLLDKIILMVSKHEQWILESYIHADVQLTRENIKGSSFLGRYLDDGNSQLCEWYNVQMCICPICYREYGQPYYAFNCKHDNEIPCI